MRRYSEAFKADVRRRMTPPNRQSVAQISAELGIHVSSLYNWRKAFKPTAVFNANDLEGATPEGIKN